MQPNPDQAREQFKVGDVALCIKSRFEITNGKLYRVTDVRERTQIRVVCDDVSDCFTRTPPSPSEAAAKEYKSALDKAQAELAEKERRIATLLYEGGFTIKARDDYHADMKRLEAELAEAKERRYEPLGDKSGKPISAEAKSELPSEPVKVEVKP